jgi:starch phosphorylase
MHEEFISQARTAYFSMEIALRADIPTYSGGLGVLAGDTLRSAADLGLPLVGVTLASREGYFRQELDARGHQTEHPEPWDPGVRCPCVLKAKITVPIEDRQVWVGGWLYVLEGHMGGSQPVILLDTDLAENGGEDRALTHHLYGGDAAYRLKQEIVLGVGGVRMLHALGFDIRQYHMNEGHSALLTLELLRRHAYSPDDVRPGESRYDIPRVRAMCNFTTHTPVEAGHDQFPYELALPVLGDFIDVALLKSFAGPDKLNMTRLALSLSDFVNGVAKRHAEVSRQMFPGYSVRAITNGVHPFTWTAPSFVKLYDQHLPGWCHEPELLVRADQIPDDAIRQAHVEAKHGLIDLVKERCGVTLHPRCRSLVLPAHDRLQAPRSAVLRPRAPEEHCGSMAVSDRARRQGPSPGRGRQAPDRDAARAHRGTRRQYSNGLRAELRHADCAYARGRRRCVAEYSAASARGERHQRHEGCLQWRALAQRSRWLVD